MAQYRVTIANGEITRLKPVCAICHEVILEKPKEVEKTYDLGEGEGLQTEVEYVHEECYNFVVYDKPITNPKLRETINDLMARGAKYQA